jgi:two-component system, probable response regulator PhcQ
MKKSVILLVDDSPSILSAMQRSLRLSAGYETLAAGSAREALDLLQAKEVDVIITDENMPGTSGTELLKICRVLHPRVVRIMVTGQTDQEVAKNAINSGEIFRFFTKPWDDFELLISIRYALERRDLSEENTKLKSELERHQEMLHRLEQQFPGITDRKLAPDGSIIIDGD